MPGTFKLIRTVQCAKCPWKCSTNALEIPDGYSLEKHKKLKRTIKPGIENFNPKVIRIMACHNSNGDDEMYCIGWLHNQLGSGNNIALRIKFRNCENLNDLKVVGKQHMEFEDTIPKVK